jgi:hypothetical protein
LLQRYPRRDLEKVAARGADQKFDPSSYAADPIGYARDVLKVEWWAKQQEVARAVLEHPMVFVKASHGVGKTHLAGGLVSWHFDSFNPSITLTTAPTAPQVNDLTWKEVRLQRRGRNMLPKAPRIEDYFPNGEINPGHMAGGYTARDADAFQGRHEEHLFLLFEEATGIEAPFWTAGEGILSSGKDNRWLVICNPVDPASPARLSELTNPRWHSITISALDHPNIRAQLLGLPKPFPKAIDLSWVEDKIERWCTPTAAAEARTTDFCWPPLGIAQARGIEPQWYRPGALFEGKVLGRWPSQATAAVWSDADWLVAESAILTWPRNCVPEVGCDPARQGNNETAIVARRGPVALSLETYNGWTLDQTAGRLKRLARDLVTELKREVPDWVIRPEDIPIKIDCDGLGVGILDQRGDFAYVEIHGQWESRWPLEYPNIRSELWFNTVEATRKGRLTLARLPAHQRAKLKVQAFGPQWKIDGSGRCQVERKEETEKRTGQPSPDAMDALNLAYLEGFKFERPAVVEVVRKSIYPSRRIEDSAQRRRGLFGLR